MTVIIKLKNIFEEKDKFKNERMQNIDNKEPEDLSDVILSANKKQKIKGL